MIGPVISAVRRFRQMGDKQPPLLLMRLMRARTIAAVLAAVSAAFALLVVLVMVLVAITAPVAIPAAIVGTVISDVADLFGGGKKPDAITGADLADAGRDADITCKPVPVSALPKPAASQPPAPVEGEPGGDQGQDDEDVTPPATVVSPIEIHADGSLEHSDAEMLVNAVPPHTSVITAHVWFLYRMAGLGDWDGFVAAYRAAGLDEKDRADDAPLAQVQKLNTIGVDIDPYRLTAAALATAGMQTQRYEVPYEDYREILSTELMSSCLQDAGLEAKRMTLPPPATPSPVPADPAPGDGSTGEDMPDEQTPSPEG
ncbi:hypothetical protein H7J07_05595 [Mycobacterium koreense]|uniref:Uncharacterized protein n=1 Tax=Mycolicibacillus koreensis TaxID=1069220 RepID=A0A7I7SBJ0_9MYCO|nr:hypothetical protein [Mycolicibacillus koreensis]MCV7247698.1 hypothetical protein [Mycolicibacillus koreensis]OSC34766.1 hypothetical protein B8W67_05835 [Mycolicibacillus koreensis]BBY54083.1 hypothetical protein MKOR_13340 [Mycolicibacillus koreensis]